MNRHSDKESFAPTPNSTGNYAVNLILNGGASVIRRSSGYEVRGYIRTDRGEFGRTGEPLSGAVSFTFRVKMHLLGPK